MTFRIEPYESLGDGVRRVVGEEAETARRELSEPPEGDLHAGIHEARKHMKKMRGVVRLVRPSLGERRYQRENRRLRDAGKRLSAVRDAEALIETFDALEQAFVGKEDFSRFHPLRDTLVERRRRIAGEQGKLARRTQEAQQVLRRVGGRAPGWPLDGTAPKDVARGLKKVYRRGGRAARRARRGDDGETLHEWRKRAKYLRYQLQVLRPLAGKWAKKRHRQVKRLGDVLGDHHDLDVLRETLDTLPASGLDRATECALRERMAKRRQQLYREALRLGKKTYGKKPKQFAAKLEGRLS